MARAFLFVVVSMLGCELPPRFIEDASQVDTYMATRSYKSACVGLRADAAAVRTYAAERLSEVSFSRVATDCLCTAVYDEAQGRFDAAVAWGMKNTRREDLAACVSPAIGDDRLTSEDRAAAIRAVGAVGAAASLGTLQLWASDDGRPEVERLAAVGAMASFDKAQVALAEHLVSNPSSAIRAEAARALSGMSGSTATDALVTAAAADEDLDVRAAAIVAVADRERPHTDRVVCEALASDDDGLILAGVQAWRGTKRARPLACLETLMKRGNLSGSVRVALLDTLGASPSDRAVDLLCAQIGPWVRSYVTDKIIVEVTGGDIVLAQNDRDHERTYECVQQALRQGGYSCYGRNYLGHWMREAGGSAPTPWCPGMDRN